MERKMNNRKRDKRIRCLNCKNTKYKIVRSHGQKSHGYKVCLFCKEVIR